MTVIQYWYETLWCSK